MRIKTAVLAVVLLCFTIFPLFASSGSDFDTQFDKCFRAFLQPNQSDAVTAQNIQAIYTITKRINTATRFCTPKVTVFYIFLHCKKLKTNANRFCVEKHRYKMPRANFRF